LDATETEVNDVLSQQKGVERRAGQQANNYDEA